MVRYEILGMPVDRIPPDHFAADFVSKAATGGRGYVCVPNVHQCILAYDEPEHAAIVRGADTVMSDSTILHKCIALKYGLPAADDAR